MSISEVVAAHGFTQVSGVLFDLGVSSMQLDESDRGFSYSHDAPLDMRMDGTQGITAYEIVNHYEPGALVKILRTFGEEKFATRIVENIVKARAQAPMNSTMQLATLVKESIPAATRRTGGNPAKRTFQALRIAVNDELGAITRAIPQALDLIEVGGRVVVMSFQSLEDKIVKEIFVEASTSKSPRNLPMDLPEFAAKFSLVIKASEKASENVNKKRTLVRHRSDFARSKGWLPNVYRSTCPADPCKGDHPIITCALEDCSCGNRWRSRDTQVFRQVSYCNRQSRIPCAPWNQYSLGTRCICSLRTQIRIEDDC
jgi:16S rRNA (cytosine(1402)-N(4))-methyltransferase